MKGHGEYFPSLQFRSAACHLQILARTCNLHSIKYDTADQSMILVL